MVRGIATQLKTDQEAALKVVLGRFVRQLLPIVATGVGSAVLGAAGTWVGGTWAGQVVAGMVAGLLLGMLLIRNPPAWLLGVHAAVAWAGYAGGALAVGATAPAAWTQAAGAIAGALIAAALSRRQPLDATGLRELVPFARIVAVGLLVVPLCQALVGWVATVVLAGAVEGGAAMVGVKVLARAWLAAALGLLAALPLLLGWPGHSDAPAGAGQWRLPRRELLVLAALAWLPVPALLWWRPELLVLGLLPMVVVAVRIGPLATACLGLLTGFAIVVFGGVFAAATAIGPETVALPASAAILAALALAILTGERDRTARGLATAREHLRAVTEHGPTLVATLDADLRHCFANRGYLEWLGREAGQVLGQTLQDVYGDTAGAIVAPIRRAFGGQPQRQQIVLPGGRELDVRFEPRFSDAGPVDGVHLLAQDAGWRSAHERSLQAMLAAALDPTLVLDAAGVIVRLNDKVEVQFGAAREAMLGQPFAAWLPAPADAELAAALARLREQRQPQQLLRALDLHARRADGSTFPAEFHLAPMVGGHGLQAVISVQDLGQRLAWERLMADTRGQAEVTLHALGDAVVACDLKQRITLFNAAAARLSGWKEDDAMGRPVGDVLPLTDPASGAVAASLLGDVLRRNAGVRQHDDRLLQRRGGEPVAVTQSAAPILDRFGQASGAVLLLHDVSQSRAQTQVLAHQALHDHLTGLPNRLLLDDRLSQALAQMDRGYKGALLYLDLDHFKPINDRLGHPVGDRVLQEVASRLRAGVREDDTVSRQGGDEFVLLLVRLADPRDAARVAEKLIHAIQQPIQIDGHELSVSASIGIALLPQDGRDKGTLTKAADAALYHAKQAGRGRYNYFTDVMSASADERVRTEHDLRIALANDDFFLDWQPQVQLPQRRVDGVEALVRWRQHDGVVVAPEDFIPVAEETGLVVQIDEWVLREACRQNRRWQEQWLEQGLPPLPVSVNVSLARFDAERLLAHVAAVLDETGLQPHWLEIEFKGAQLFAQGARGQALVAALKALGVRVAADDFGSGTASLGALTEFAFDTLKIDRSFVRTIVDQAASRAVAAAVLGIGQAMGYRVIAKGVEADAQHDALVRLGCGGMQGALFGEAGTAQRFAELVAQAGGAQTGGARGG